MSLCWAHEPRRPSCLLHLSPSYECSWGPAVSASNHSAAFPDRRNLPIFGLDRSDFLLLKSSLYWLTFPPLGWLKCDIWFDPLGETRHVLQGRKLRNFVMEWISWLQFPVKSLAGGVSQKNNGVWNPGRASCGAFGCFHKWGYPKIDGLSGEIPLKWMIWGYHPF